MCKRSGFSLLEALIVIFLLVILALFGLSLKSDWYQDQMIWVMQQDIEQAIEHGVQESLILGEPLRLIPLRHQDWSSGLALLRESELQQQSPTTLFTWPWRSSDKRVVWHGFLSNHYLRFTPEISQAVLNGYFRIDTTGRDQAVTLIVNRLGKIRIIKS